MLTITQITAILFILQAFGVPSATLTEVQGILMPEVVETPIVQSLAGVEAPTAPLEAISIVDTAPDIEVATSTSIIIKASQTNVRGGACDQVDFRVQVLDQFGGVMDKKVSMITALGVSTKQSPAQFRYKPTATSTVETVRFTSNGLEATSTINIGAGLYGVPDNTIIEAGLRFDPLTRLCR